MSADEPKGPTVGDRRLLESLTRAEVERFRATTSQQEWDALGEEIKLVRGGQLPQRWHVQLVTSGVQAEAQKRWRKQGGAS